jgi:DNA-binding MarR family transcriptional regulator
MPPTETQADPASDVYVERIADLFVRVMHRILTLDLLTELAKGETTPSLLAAMWHIDQQGTCSVRSIAEGMAVTFSAASQLVDRLVKRGLATREEAKHDRRLCDVSLTPEGETIVRRLRSARGQRVSAALARMRPGQRKALVEGLEGFIRAVASGEDARSRICLVCGKEHIPGCVAEPPAHGPVDRPLRASSANEQDRPPPPEVTAV